MHSLLFVGFGNVGQACAQLLLGKKQSLEEENNFKYKVVGIVDSLKGSVYNENGIDLTKALNLVSNNKSLDEYPDGIHEGDVLK